MIYIQVHVTVQTVQYITIYCCCVELVSGSPHGSPLKTATEVKTEEAGEVNPEQNPAGSGSEPDADAGT